MKILTIFIISLIFIACGGKKDIGHIQGSSMNNLPYNKYINEVKVELDNELKSDIAKYDSHVIELFYNYDKAKEDTRYRQKRKGL